MRRIRITREGRALSDEGNDEFYSYIKDLVHHPAVLEMKKYPHHGTTSCYQHCLNVSYYNYRICKYFGLDARSAARAGMLHDLFLYDWHEHAAKTGDHFHGMTHPKAALRNAERYFELTDLEREIILRHMFPVTPVPPKHKEGFVICFTDKYCGSCETADGHRPKRIPRKFPLFRKVLEIVFGQDYVFRDYELSSVNAAKGGDFVTLRKRPSGKWKNASGSRKRRR